jgi:predicted CopG family antitoxin
MRIRTDRTGRSFTTVSVDIDTYNKLEEIAQKEERSISWVVKRLTREYKPQE